MSTYTHRLIEGKFAVFDGTVQKYDELPKNPKDGSLYRVWNSEYRYYKYTNGEWVGQNESPCEWRLLAPYTPLVKKPTRATYIKKAEPKEYPNTWKGKLSQLYDKITHNTPKDEVCYYDNEDERLVEFRTEDDKQQFMLKHYLWCNNGGPIRDEYISGDWDMSGCTFSKRGVPDDISKETRIHMSNPDNGRLRGWSITYVTLSEWIAFYSSEETRIMGLLNEAYEKQHKKVLDKKLDFIINNMKSPLDADIKGFYESFGSEEDEEDDYDSPKYVISEYIPNLYAIAQEIAKTELLSEYYNIYDANDVRIIYFLE